MTPTPGSPTSRLLMEYEMHLRNTLAKGMDAESYSLHTFEALLSQSMENLGEFNASLLASSLVLVLVWVSAFSSSIRFAVRIRRNLVIFHSLFVLVGVVAILLLLLSSLCLLSSSLSIVLFSLL